MKSTLPVLPGLLHAFFHEWLVEQRNASHRTVLAYRDAWRLFLRFVAARQKKKVAVIRTEDLTGTEVLAFLQHIETDRRASISTRNCRLAAIRSFFSFVADREPRAAKLCADVLRVPFKKAPKRAMSYLESAEMAAILSQPDQATPEGQRDHTLLSVLYNTGARIQEALDLRPQDIHLKSPPHVRLIGKECHSYCISFRRRRETTIIHACRQACGLAFSSADVLLVVRIGIGLGPYTDAHGAGRVGPMYEPYPV